MESCTIAQLIRDIIPKYYGVTSSEGFNVVFPDQVIDGSICILMYQDEMIANFRIRFTNKVELTNGLTEVNLKCIFTNLVFTKKMPIVTPRASDVKPPNIMSIENDTSSPIETSAAETTQPVASNPVANNTTTSAKKVSPPKAMGRGKKSQVV